MLAPPLGKAVCCVPHPAEWQTARGKQWWGGGVGEPVSPIWGPSQQFSDERTTDSALGHLPHKGQVGQPALVREAAVTAEQITQRLGRESDNVPSPLPPGHTSLEVVLIIRKPAPACISEFEVLNYLLINPEITEWDRDGGRGRAKVLLSFKRALIIGARPSFMISLCPQSLTSELSHWGLKGD